jgi:hypothetical protein
VFSQQTVDRFGLPGAGNSKFSSFIPKPTMVTPEMVRAIALSFDEVVELPHFELTSFRVRKKIFATMDVKKNRAVLMLPVLDQSVFSAFDKNVMYPLPNAWGKRGATAVDLKKVRKDMLRDALTVAYCNKAPKKVLNKCKPLPPRN